MDKLNRILNYSVGVGRLFSIPIRLHITLVFFLWPLLRSHGDALHTIEFILAIVLSILLHELGHALTAKHYRMGGLSIMLHGFGGFATSSGYRSPKQALMITLAGPAVTFALGLICSVIGNWGFKPFSIGSEAATQFYMLHVLGALNILLGFLNMLPSLLFDGGNALVAILSFRLAPTKASRAVGHIGLVASSILLLYALVTNNQFVVIFGLMGLIGSLIALYSSGGIRFGEMFDDRKARKAEAAEKERKAAKSRAYLDDVNSRQKEREERERLRKILESSLDE